MNIHKDTRLINLTENINGKIYTERWLPIKGYEGHYLISDFGRVKSLKRKVHHKKSGHITMPEKILKQKIRNDGYNEVNLCINGVHRMTRIHTCVGLHFLYNPNNYKEINHKNGLKADNRFHQLEWVTPSQNIKHSYVVLKRKHSVGYGEKNPNFKYFLNLETGIYYTYNDLSFQLGLSLERVRSLFCYKDKRLNNFIVA